MISESLIHNGDFDQRLADSQHPTELSSLKFRMLDCLNNLMDYTVLWTIQLVVGVYFR